MMPKVFAIFSVALSLHPPWSGFPNFSCLDLDVVRLLFFRETVAHLAPSSSSLVSLSSLALLLFVLLAQLFSISIVRHVH